MERFTAWLREKKPARQFEAVELMISANSISVAYPRALVRATAAEMLVKAKGHKGTLRKIRARVQGICRPDGPCTSGVRPRCGPQIARELGWTGAPKQSV